MRNFKSILLSLVVFLMLGITFWLWSWTSFSKIWAPIAQPQTAFFSWGCVANSAGACSSTGKYRASWTLLMQIWSGWVINAFVPLLDWSWNSFLTGGATSGVYLTIANSWVYFNTYSGTYYTSNPLWYITWLSLSWYLSGYTVATGDWVYSWDSTILASTRATSEYIDTYSQSLGDIYTTGYYYVSWATISRLGLLSWVMTMEDYTGGVWVPQICVSNANSWTYFNANSGTYFNTYSGTYYTTNPLWYITW
jgi:hypothetical protein